MFGKKKKITRRIHINRALDEVSNLQRMEEIIIYRPRADTTAEAFKQQVESIAFRRSLMVLSEPETDGNDNFYMKLRKI